MDSKTEEMDLDEHFEDSWSDQNDRMSTNPSIFSWGRTDMGGLFNKNSNEKREGVFFFNNASRTFLSISSNIYHSAAVTATGELYTCGANFDGQVSTSDDEFRDRPHIFESLSNQRISSVACGLNHTVCITATGCAMSFGGNESGQLGHSAGILSKVSPKMVNFDTSHRSGPIVIKKATCGDLFTLFLTTSGEVYGCGSSVYLGKAVHPCNICPAQRIEPLIGSYVIDIVAGASHAIALTRSGEVYTWGANQHNQLGYYCSNSSLSSGNSSISADLLTSSSSATEPVVVSSPTHQQTPQKAVFPDGIGKVVGIAAGSSHSLVWTNTGILLGAGANKYGQLALPVPRVNSFECIPLPHYCTMAACGANHTLVLCNTTEASPSRNEVVTATSATINDGNHHNNTNNNNSLSTAALHANSSNISSNGIAITRTVSLGSESSLPPMDVISAATHTAIYGFGGNINGQVDGTSTATMFRTPVELRHLYTAWDVSQTLYIAAGGDHSFAICIRNSGNSSSNNSRALAENSSRLLGSSSICSNLPAGSSSTVGGGPLMRRQFSTQASKATSVMTASSLLTLLHKAVEEQQEQHEQSNSNESITSTTTNTTTTTASKRKLGDCNINGRMMNIAMSTVCEIFSSPSLLSGSFTIDPHSATAERQRTVINEAIQSAAANAIAASAAVVRNGSSNTATASSASVEKDSSFMTLSHTHSPSLTTTSAAADDDMNTSMNVPFTAQSLLSSILQSAVISTAPSTDSALPTTPTVVFMIPRGGRSISSNADLAAATTNLAQASAEVSSNAQEEEGNDVATVNITEGTTNTTAATTSTTTTSVTVPMEIDTTIPTTTTSTATTDEAANDAVAATSATIHAILMAAMSDMSGNPLSSTATAVPSATITTTEASIPIAVSNLPAAQPTTATAGILLETTATTTNDSVTKIEVSSSTSSSTTAALMTIEEPLLDIEGIEECYVALLQLGSIATARLLAAMQQSITVLEHAVSSSEVMLPESVLRVLLILWQSPLMAQTAMSADLMTRLLALLQKLLQQHPRWSSDMITVLLRLYPDHLLVARLLRPLQAHLSQNIQHRDNATCWNVHSNIGLLCTGLQWLFQASQYKPNTQLLVRSSVDSAATMTFASAAGVTTSSIPPEIFYNNDISNMSDAVLLRDFIQWRHEKQSEHARRTNTGNTASAVSTVPPGHLFLSSYAFLLSAAAKRRILLAEAYMQQRHAQSQAVAVGMLSGSGIFQPYFVMPIEREHLLEHALIHTSAASDLDLKKPLKAIFLGEEGIDEGGVRKEFFQLLIVQLFAEQYGLFYTAPSGRVSWINQCNNWSCEEFRLVGTLLALAVYNDVLLDVHLPSVLYKKLLNVPVDLEDLRGIDPELCKGLHQLLEYEPASEVEAVFCRTFSVEWEEFGAKRIKELIPMGEQTAVTGENRVQYVQLLVQWLLVGSIADQFDALYSGFSRVVDRMSMILFTASELELMMVGTPHLDFKELQNNTEYIGENDWNADHPTIAAFWSVLHSLPLEEKQKFLLFVTGSNKAPIGGLKNIGLKIQRMGPDSNSLPTAHTCFNTLLLPAYADPAHLKNRLMTAIYECAGFGLK